MTDRSRVLSEPTALIGGRPAFVLSKVLEGSLRHGLTLRALLAEIGVGERDRADALEAAATLAEVGEQWRRAQLPQPGNAATGGNHARVPLCSVVQASQILSRSPRRVRQYAAAGDLAAEKTHRGWVFAHSDVVGFRDRLAGQRV